MSNRKEAIFCFKEGEQSPWLAEKPSPHRKSHINYSQSTFTVIGYIMQRFELTQEGALQVLGILFQQLGVSIPIPSQATVSRELKKYKRVLHGWKYVIIGSKSVDKIDAVGISYKKPSNENLGLITISADQSRCFTIFKFNNQSIKLKRVANVKTTPPFNKAILASNNKIKADNYSTFIAKWLHRNSALINQIKHLIKLDGSQLFNALIPLMPKLKDPTKKLLTDDHYSILRTLSNKRANIKSSLLKAEVITNISHIEHHIYAQAILFKYNSPEIKADVHRLAIWIYCPYSKLSFIRLNNTEFVDKSEFDKLEINSEEVDNYTSIEMKGKILNLKLTKKNNKLKFYLALIDEETFFSWNCYLQLSSPEKNKVAIKKINEPEVWSYENQDICVGEKVVKDKEIMMTRKQPLNAFIIDFPLGNRKGFSKNSFTKHLKIWVSHLNETSQASPEDNQTYQNNRHMLNSSD